jgi:phytoene synthase
VLPTNGELQAPPGEASALLKTLSHLVEHDVHLLVHDHSRLPLPLDDAYAMCAAITREHSRSFFLSSQLLPAEKRRAIRALYAFCRTSDDLVDRAQGEADRALARWVALVHAPHPPVDDPVLLAWNDTVAHYSIPQTLVDELLAGVAMDLKVKRYETFDQLWLYSYRVASVVGLLSMEIIGYRQGAAPYAVKLGVALQLTNILRDVGEDAARGRIYLPQEDMERFGVSDDDILHGRRDDRFRALMQFQIERAHVLYEEAWPGIALLSRDSQFAIGAAAEIYRGILAKIVQNDYDVYTRRAHLSLPGKVLMLARIYRRVRALP